MEYWDLFFRDRDREVISLIGSGGKTHLMRLIAEHYRKNKKILISATVDMQRIPEEETDFLDYGWLGEYTLFSEGEKGVYLLSDGITNDNMLRGITSKEADDLSPGFDITITECDISRKRYFKAWRENEPDIPSSTTQTVIILDLMAVGAEINSENIYNLDIFMDVTGKKQGEKVTPEDLLIFFLGADSIIKKTPGTKILFMNKAETPELKDLAVSLSEEFRKVSDFSPDYILSGSFHQREYRLLYAKDPEENKKIQENGETAVF